MSNGPRAAPGRVTRIFSRHKLLWIPNNSTEFLGLRNNSKESLWIPKDAYECFRTPSHPLESQGNPGLSDNALAWEPGDPLKSRLDREPAQAG